MVWSPQKVSMRRRLEPRLNEAPVGAQGEVGAGRVGECLPPEPRSCSVFSSWHRAGVWYIFSK